MALRRLFASWAATAFVWACFIDAAEGDRCGAGTLNLGEPIVTVSFIGNTTNTTTTTTYGEPEESYLWVAGAFTSIVGSVCSNLGVNVQKYSFNKEEKKPLNKRRKYIKMPGYWIGIALVIIGALGDFVALGMAAQSIVAPIGAITLVANVLFAHFWLKEHLSKWDLVGTCCILFGSVVAVMFGDHADITYSMDDLLCFYSLPGFIAYALICFTFLLIMYGIIKYAEPFAKRLKEAIAGYEQAQKDANLDLAIQYDTEIYECEQDYQAFSKIHPFAYCAMAGTFGGQNILFGKMVAVLIAKSISGENQFGYPMTYVFIVAMVTSIMFQQHFLATALSFFDALYVVPVFQCFFITVSTLAGAAYFSEFSRFQLLNWIFFPMGLMVTMYGVKILSGRKMESGSKGETRSVQLKELSRRMSKIDSGISENMRAVEFADQVSRLGSGDSDMLTSSMSRAKSVGVGLDLEGDIGSRLGVGIGPLSPLVKGQAAVELKEVKAEVGAGPSAGAAASEPRRLPRGKSQYVQGSRAMVETMLGTWSPAYSPLQVSQLMQENLFSLAGIGSRLDGFKLEPSAAAQVPGLPRSETVGGRSKGSAFVRGVVSFARSKSEFFRMQRTSPQPSPPESGTASPDQPQSKTPAGGSNTNNTPVQGPEPATAYAPPEMKEMELGDRGEAQQ